MPLRISPFVKALATGTALAGLALGSAGAAHAQAPSLPPLNVTPVPDVYAALALHSELLPLFGTPVLGQFRTLTVIGDSFADFGNALRAFTNPLTGAVLVNPLTGIPVVSASTETGRFGNYLNSIDALQYRFAIPTSNVTNYAVGGAGNGTLNPVAPGFLPGIAQQIDALVASGRRFGPRDLVAYTTTGGNDALAGVPAVISTANLVNNVQRLALLGARTMILTGTGSDEYNLSQRVALSQFANSGTRLFYLDLAALGRQVSANPAAYGFTNVTTICRPTPISTPCAPTIATQNRFLMWDGVHLTTAGNAIIGAYEANQINAPSTVAAQAELGQIAGTSFANSILARLDAYRWQNTGWTANAAFSADLLGRALPAAQVPVAFGSPFSLYAMGTYSTGDKRDRLSAFGYDYDAGAITVGGEYRAAPNLVLGAAFNYANPHIRLNQSFGDIDLQAYQASGYASLSFPNWYVDGVITWGASQYDIRRPGVISQITGLTEGDTFTGSIKAGYLFDLGRMNIGPFAFSAVQLGPIAGLTYANTRIDAYTERGDPLLTQGVRRQQLEGLTGSAGLQLRCGYQLFGWRVSSFLNLTAEHDFLDDIRIINTFLTSVPELGIRTNSGTRREETYGKIASGFNVDFTANLSGMVGSSSTFGRDAGQDYAVQAGLRYRF